MGTGTPNSRMNIMLSSNAPSSFFRTSSLPTSPPPHPPAKPSEISRNQSLLDDHPTPREPWRATQSRSSTQSTTKVTPISSTPRLKHYQHCRRTPPTFRPSLGDMTRTPDPASLTSDFPTRSFSGLRVPRGAPARKNVRGLWGARVLMTRKCCVGSVGRVAGAGRVAVTGLLKEGYW